MIKEALIAQTNLWGFYGQFRLLSSLENSPEIFLVTVTFEISVSRMWMILLPKECCAMSAEILWASQLRALLCLNGQRPRVLPPYIALADPTTQKDPVWNAHTTLLRNSVQMNTTKPSDKAVFPLQVRWVPSSQSQLSRWRLLCLFPFCSCPAFGKIPPQCWSLGLCPFRGQSAGGNQDPFLLWSPA